MKRACVGLLYWIASSALLLGVPTYAQESAATAKPAAATVAVVLHTSGGDVHLALEASVAPITTANFLHYVDQKRFDGATFYRAMKLGDDDQHGIVQGGLRGDPKRVFKPIAHESTDATGLSHVDGAISMARGDPGSASADFFIVVGEELGFDARPDDPGYAVFGHVTEGMNVVRAMLAAPRSAAAGEGLMKGQMLAKPVRILTARRE